MKRKSSIYLSYEQKSLFKKEIYEMSNIFHEKLLSSFNGDYQKELNEYEQSLLSELEPTPIVDREGNLCDYEFDLSEIEGKIAERYYLLSTTRYRVIAMWICCLCEVWEQQLQLFLKLEKQNGNLMDNYELARWNQVKRAYWEYGIDFEKFSSWQKLNELRLLVNVIKHGEGGSEKSLRRIRPDLFIVEKYDKFSFFHSSLITRTLNLIESDIDGFANAIIEFWEYFPSDSYLYKKENINN